MKVYHYTKGMSLFSIFTDGFIATENKRGLSGFKKNTNCVWLTAKEAYPKTALPCIPNMPSTNLMAHVENKSIEIDLDELGTYVGGVFRFAFDTNKHKGLMKWRDSGPRKQAMQNRMWQAQEQIANLVGDDISKYWISSKDVPLFGVTLQQYKGGWVDVLTDFDVRALTIEQADVLDMLMTMSAADLRGKGLPLHHIKV
jgi:hypothetical protein